MAEQMWERELLAAILNGEIEPNDYRASELNHKDFDDAQVSPIFKVIDSLVKRELEVTSDTIYTEYCLQNDRGPKADAVRKTMDLISRKDVDSSKYSLEFMLEKKRVKKLKAFSDKLYYALDSNRVEEAEGLISSFRPSLSVGQDFRLMDILDPEEFEKTHLERQETLDTGRNFNFLDDLAGFNKYLEVGIEDETLTAYGGATNVGKSILLFNIALQSVDPRNGLPTLIVKTENRFIQGATRWQAILFDVPLGEMYQPDAKEKQRILEERKDQGWADAFMVKVPVAGCNIHMIERVMEQIHDKYGVEVNNVFIDSPDHMEPVSKDFEARWMKKADVYNDLKFLGEKYSLKIQTTLPLKASTVGKDHIGSEGAAGAYDIAKLVDMHFNILKTEEDIRMKRRTIEIAKTRDGEADSEKFHFKITPSLRFEKFNKDDDQTAKNFIVKRVGEDKSAKVVYKLGPANE